MYLQEEAVVVFSGGQDSTTCLFWAMKNFKSVRAIAFNYGQRHKLELEMAKDLADQHQVPIDILDMGLLNQLAPNALTREDTNVETDVTEGQLPNTFVEGRNLLFLTFAAIYAKGKGCRHLITGVSQSDFSGYPDCRDTFIRSTNVTLNLAMDYSFVIHTPLMWIDKKATWAMADDLGVLELVRDKTLTCYNGIVGMGCGECPACKLRQNGYDAYMNEKQL